MKGQEEKRWDGIEGEGRRTRIVLFNRQELDIVELVYEIVLRNFNSCCVNWFICNNM